MKIREYFKRFPYRVLVGKNGLKFVDLRTVRKDECHLSFQNSKTGKVIAFNLPVELTCLHTCECYIKKACYACSGCYQFTMNQAIYAENLVFFLTHSNDDFIAEITRQIRQHKSRTLFRWFTCGDIVNERFLECMIAVAKLNPAIRFWTYTKKYEIVNKYVDKYGLKIIPENLHIIFSHWMNEDGSYFPMDNRHDFPTSEFIPIGKEDLLDTVTNICPCSNPNIVEHCANCSTPCYELKHGESMALVEHSTKRTKERDRVIKAITGKKHVDDLKTFLKSFAA